MSKLSILIVEDEHNLGSTLSEYLTAKGHTCHWSDTAKLAREEFNAQSFNVILMDIGLPDGNGIELAKEFRSIRKDFILLFLSALNDPATRLEGLELGAEDYITKPFELKELQLRLSRIAEFKNLSDQKSYYEFGALKIWFDRFEIQDGNGNVLPLSQKEGGILSLLVQNKNNVLARETIIEEIWGQSAFPSNRTVDNYIVKLRKWCESDPNSGVKITSVRGIGYKLEC